MQRLLPTIALSCAMLACSREGLVVAERDPKPVADDASVSTATAPSSPEPTASDEPTPVAEDDLDPTKPCTVPAVPIDVVVTVRRLVVPIGKEPRSERGEVTAHGTCTPSVECAKVSDAVLAGLVAKFRLAQKARHTSEAMSPHYGGRWVSVRFTTGACVAADSGELPVLAADRKLFDDAFDAAVDVLVAAHADAGPP